MSTAKPPSVYLQDEAEIKKVFNRFDINNDGKISSSELVNVMKTLGSETSDEEVGKIMAQIDLDEDGVISLDEFTAFLKATEGGEAGDGDAELRDAFSMYDQNKNGLISAVELHQILSKLGESCTVEDCGKMIQSVDSDGDGHISFDEFKKMMANGSAAK